MDNCNVTIFKAYPFSVGEKIRIDGGVRSGDWEIIDISEKKIKLRCPVSFKELEVDRFCYHLETLEDAEWPKRN